MVSRYVDQRPDGVAEAVDGRPGDLDEVNDFDAGCDEQRRQYDERQQVGGHRAPRKISGAAQLDEDECVQRNGDHVDGGNWPHVAGVA